MLRILVKPDEERPIGATLALLGTPGEALSEAEMQQLLGEDAASAAALATAAAVATAPPPTAPSATQGSG